MLLKKYNIINSKIALKKADSKFSRKIKNYGKHI